MDNTVLLMFYKGEGQILDKLIRLWTRSKYSHVEIVLTEHSHLITYSAYPEKGVIRQVNKKYNNDEWDIVPLKVDNYEDGLKFLKNQVGKDYDYKAIFLTFIFPFKSENPKKWFCSEYNAKYLKISLNDGYKFFKRPSRIHPGKLNKYVRKYKESLNNGGI